MPPNESPLSRLSDKQFGVPTYPRQTVHSIGATPVRLLQNDPARMSWVVTNNDTVNGAVSFDGGKTYGQGFHVLAGGGVISMSVIEDGEAVGWELFAVSETGTIELITLEVIAV